MRRHRDPRIGVFEAALRSGKCNHAQRVLCARHEYWVSLHWKPETVRDEFADSTETAVIWAMPFADVLLYVGLVLGLLGVTAVAAFLTTAALVLVIPIVAIWAAVGLANRARNVRTMVDSAQDLGVYEIRVEGRCMNCQYDITGCNDEYEVVSPVPLGPRRCPECGSFWPRVPDPTPDEMHRWHRSWFIKR